MRGKAMRSPGLVSALAAVSLSPLLGACGVPAQPQAAPSSYVMASAAPMKPAGSSFAETDDPVSDAEPTLQASQAKAAAEQFIETSLTIGYPLKTYTDHLNRLKPLMTPSGFAAQQQSDQRGRNPEHRAAQFYRQRIRVVPKLTSVNVTVAGADTATVTVAAATTRQQRRGSKWTSTGPVNTRQLTITLSATRGDWLVDSVTPTT